VGAPDPTVKLTGPAATIARWQTSYQSFIRPNGRVKGGR
jgi:hypothetical protein